MSAAPAPRAAAASALARLRGSRAGRGLSVALSRLPATARRGRPRGPLCDACWRPCRGTAARSARCGLPAAAEAAGPCGRCRRGLSPFAAGASLGPYEGTLRDGHARAEVPRPAARGGAAGRSSCSADPRVRALLTRAPCWCPCRCTRGAGASAASTSPSCWRASCAPHRAAPLAPARWCGAQDTPPQTGLTAAARRRQRARARSRCGGARAVAGGRGAGGRRVHHRRHRPRLRARAARRRARRGAAPDRGARVVDAVHGGRIEHDRRDRSAVAAHRSCLAALVAPRRPPLAPGDQPRTRRVTERGHRHPAQGPQALLQGASAGDAVAGPGGDAARRGHGAPLRRRPPACPSRSRDLPRTEAALKEKLRRRRRDRSGRLPWLIQESYARLVEAFKAGDKARILDGVRHPGRAGGRPAQPAGADRQRRRPEDRSSTGCGCASA